MKHNSFLTIPTFKEFVKIVNRKYDPEFVFNCLLLEWLFVYEVLDEDEERQNKTC